MTTTHLMIAEAIGFLVVLIPILCAAFKHRERGDAWEDYAHGLEEECKEAKRRACDAQRQLAPRDARGRFTIRDLRKRA